MKKINKAISLLVLVLHFTTTLLAQQSGGFSPSGTMTMGPVMMGPAMQIGQTGNSGSSSFGSKSGVVGAGMTDVSPRGSSLLQEQTYGGLTYQVHILGEVAKPGTYRMPASTRLSEALDRAGGVSGRGSLRRIEVKRRQELENKIKSTSVDLFQFRQKGDLNANPYLLDNDVVYVPLQGKVVQIVGTVMRPGIYELVNEKSLEDLVGFVGGYTQALQEEAPLKVIRYVSGQKQIIDVRNDVESRKSFVVQNADVVIAPNFLIKDKKFDYNLPYLPGDADLFIPSFDNKVFVLGAVFSPGPYGFAPYYGVRQYLTLAGGTTKLAKSRKIRVVRSDGKTVRAKNNTIVNPGDTVIVPEKYLPPEGLLSLVLGLTTSVLGITTTILTLNK